MCVFNEHNVFPLITWDKGVPAFAENVQASIKSVYLCLCFQLHWKSQQEKILGLHIRLISVAMGIKGILRIEGILLNDTIF